tara:strand:+ start:604 stop:951 length:348 start_codon:yes stop_codon:yes gene_type:complete
VYKDKLKDPRWKSFAKRVYARDDYRCTFNCNVSGIPLNAHHRVYYKENGKFVDPWDYPLGDLQTLCSSCHNIYHNLMNTTTPIRDRKTRKLLNEDEAYKKTRLIVEKLMKGESDA